MGFDELGEHGMVTGEISKLGNKLEFIKLDELEFKKQELDCTELNSIEEIIEKINSINLEENKLYEIILIGKRNFEININEIYKYYLDEKIIKIQKEIEDRERGRKCGFSLSGSMFFCISGRICGFDCRRRRTDLTSGIYDCGTAGTYCNCNK